jgi:hypothetical protein
VEKYGTARHATGDNIIRLLRVARWITKATDTHSEYVIFIASARQKWLRERASMLRYAYIASSAVISTETRPALGATQPAIQSTEGCFPEGAVGEVALAFS